MDSEWIQSGIQIGVQVGIHVGVQMEGACCDNKCKKTVSRIKALNHYNPEFYTWPK